MFCPNCGAEIGVRQNFCRLCGLKLEGILQVLSEQIPTKEYARLQKRKELFEKLGIFSLSCFGLIGVSFFFSEIVYYKMLLFGANAIFWSGFTAFVIFGLLAVFFFNYPKLFMNPNKVNPYLSPPPEREISDSTNKHLPDASFEPIPGITENTTDLLLVKMKKTSGDL